MIYEGIFRKPRLKTNKILKRFAHLFDGHIINVSGSSDSDKNTSFYDYYFGDYDKGERYKDYFSNALSYTVSNYPLDQTDYQLDKTNMIFLDLEKTIPNDLIGRYNVVFSHTVFEHIFDIFKAFKNLCMLSNDIIIFIVPQHQQIHDYYRGYKDYWRFTPFAVEKLFEENQISILYRETTKGFSSSMYLFYIGTKNPEKWNKKFEPICSVSEYLNYKNNGSTYTLFSLFIIKFDSLIRRIFRNR